ncbi:MAG: lysylphosphatidylglycerol synthase transmembrane domain-containing protein [Steroidobacteraceae bacterium]
MPKPIGLILKLLISAGLLSFIFSSVPVSQLTSILRDVSPWPFLAALALTPCMVYLAATQTKVLTDQQGLTLGVGQIFAVTFATAFYGLLLPGAIVGGAVRWYKFSQQDKKPAQALAAIAFGRLMNTLVLAVTGLVCWALDPQARQNMLNGAILGTAMLGLCGVYLLFFRRRQAQMLTSLLGRQTYIPVFIRLKLAKGLSAASDFQGLPVPRILTMTTVFAIYHFLGIASFHLLALAVPVDLSLSNIGWIRTYILFIMALPISIMGLGVREGALIFMLQAYGIPPPAALAYSFLILARTLFTATVGGVIELVQFLRPTRLSRHP